MKKEIQDNRERRFISIPFKIERRDGDGDGEEKKKIVFYPAVFNKWSRNFGGWFREKLDPGCFDGVLDDPETVCLVNHNNDLLLGRNKRTMTLSVDDKGLKVELDPPDTSLGRDIIEQIERRDIESGSFEMEIEAQLWEESDSDEVEEDRTIIRVGKLFDVSLVTRGMYPDAADVSVAKRSFDEWAKENRKEKEELDNEEVATERDYLEMELDIRKRKH